MDTVLPSQMIKFPNATMSTMATPFVSPVKIEAQSSEYNGFSYLNRTASFDYSDESESAGSYMSSDTCTPTREILLDDSLCLHENGLIDSFKCTSSLKRLRQEDGSGNDESSKRVAATNPYDIIRGKGRLKVSYEIAQKSMDKPHKCEKCYKGFDRQEHLTRHNKTKSHRETMTKHGIATITPPEAYCPVCGKGFTRSDNVKPHIRTHMHNGELSYKNSPISVEESVSKGLEKIDPRLNQSPGGKVSLKKSRAKKRGG